MITDQNASATGVGNPSATINYVRKKPTGELQASASIMLGSWDQKRVEADVSGPLNAAGTVRARLIFAHEDRDSYLRYNHVNRNVNGAMVDWDVTDRRFDPARGSSIEDGIKSEWFDRHLYASASIFRARQKDYAVLDLMASIKPLDRLTASINVRNVTDTKIWPA